MNATNYLTLRQVRLKPSQEWSGEERGQLTFVFLKSGQGSYASGIVRHRLTPGDVLVEQVNARAGGKIGVAGGGELNFWSFSVSLENLFPLFAPNEVCMLQSLTDSFKAAKLHSARSPAAVECHRLLAELPPEQDLTHRSQLLRIVAAILSPEFKHAHRERVGYVPAEEHVTQVFESISADEILSSPVGELATRFSYSRRHLGRMFQSHFGMSVSAMRMEMRLLKAVSLLRNPDNKIISVADECGFKHLGQFNTCFKRRFGECPGQWRKSAESVENHSTATTRNGAASSLHTNGSRPVSQSPPPRRNGDSHRALAGNGNSIESSSHLVATPWQSIRPVASTRNGSRVGVS